MYLVDKKFEYELRQKLVNRDSDAWTLFYECFLDPIYEFVYYRVWRNHEVAEDIAQTAFIEAIRSIGGYDPERGSLYTWLKGITRNHLYRYYREKAKEKGVKEKAMHEIEEHVLGTDIKPISIKRLEQEELRRQVESALKALPLHYRALLAKKYI